MRYAHPVLLLAALAAAIPAPLHAQREGPLRVTRATPSGDASPTTTISVSFDRPVAGSLDRSVDPTTILRVQPAIAGKLEWRDPVTIRLTPSKPLASGTQYTVSVANSFRAMDGSALAEPYTFSFRVRGPTLLGGNPVNQQSSRTTLLRLDQRFDVVYSAPVDLARLSAAAYLELDATCAPARRIIQLAAASQRPFMKDDATAMRASMGWAREGDADSLRRVVRLVPRAPLPRACRGDLVLPSEVDERAPATPTRWAFATYGEFLLSSLACGGYQRTGCPSGPLVVTFNNPVRGGEVLRHVKVLPDTKFTIRDTTAESTTWVLEGAFKPRTGYALVADMTMRDVFDQTLKGNPAAGFRTSGFAPTITHPFGRLLVERQGFRTLAVQHVNVDTLETTIAPVPVALEPTLLTRFAWGTDSVWQTLLRGATVQRVAVRNPTDRGMVTGVALPVADASRPETPTLFAVRVRGRSVGDSTTADDTPALVQVTDLGVHARIGITEGVVWVTGVSDGKARAGVTVELHDAQGKRVASARTDDQGLAQLANLRDLSATAVEEDDEEGSSSSFEGYVTATLGNDRAVAAINRYDPDLSPWRFGARSAWGEAERLPLAGAVFTERGIYRPGERVYAKAIVRDGKLGALRAPAAGDSVKWIFHDREGGVLRETTLALNAFGTSSQTLAIPAGAPVGLYEVSIQSRRAGKWLGIANTSYRVAEYRPPEFLVDVAGDTMNRLPGDLFVARARARYLFGAPMGRAVVEWQARTSSVSSWSLHIPGTEGWYIGDSGFWWDWDDDDSRGTAEVFSSRTDTLDARGERAYSLKLPPITNGRAARVLVEATVTDVNRQSVSSRSSVLVHPADFYLAAKPSGTDWFWKARTPQTIQLRAVRPNGTVVTGVHVTGTVVHREWHQVRRERNGISELVGDWVSDTVAHCNPTTADTPVSCAFTPAEGGAYVVSFTAKDRAGRSATTSFTRYTYGEGWVPWSDETQFKMDVLPDRTRYSVGDTATVMFASPFTDAEAWITVEREGLLQQRRVHLTSGSTTLKFPITEAFAPNAFISIIVARGRSAPPGSLDDAGRPTIRVGYTELRVTPEVKRLTVNLAADRTEYRPGDTARVSVRVRDVRAQGARSEVTLWAVDEGVLSLTGYKTPDPLDLLYRERGLGMRLASNMTSVAPQIPEGEKGRREAGGGGGADGADILRSRFQTTAFFLGSVVTDAQGNATASAKLPDNLTTFRVMAVAVTAGDRFGKGQSSMLVTRPLLARQALPRFVRPADQFEAGAVISRRDGAAVPVKVTASATGVALRGDAERATTLAALRGSEVRFPFQAQPGDSATFRFDVTDDRNADAVRVSIPVRPDHHPVAHTIAGTLRDTATVEFALPSGIDPARSRLALHVGNSPIAPLRAIGEALHVYPYYCSEQVISAATPIIALHRLQRLQGSSEKVSGDPMADITRAVAMLSGRQRADGGIGYWSSTDWTSPWLSAYAGMVLLDARDEGAAVDTLVLSRLADYLRQQLGAPSEGSVVAFTPVSGWNVQRSMQLRQQVASVDLLSRMGRPVIAAENELLRSAAFLTLEDRARLAEVLARRQQLDDARRIMQSVWAQVRLEGNRATLADTTRENFYFFSVMRPYGRILTATLAVDPQHVLVGALVETIAQQGRVSRGEWYWNTQDYAATATALAALEQRRRAQGDRTVRVRAGSTVLLQGGESAQRAAADSTISLQGLLSNDGGKPRLRLSLDAGAGNVPLFYYLTVTEVPLAPPVTPEDRGIRVERWYERYDGRGTVTSVAEGELVRVRLKITVPQTRYFVVLDDALPAGLEAVDLSLRTAATLPGPGVKTPADRESEEPEEGGEEAYGWYGSWDSGWWSPFDHRELRDDRVVYSATVLWRGTYTATYLARATTPGSFIRPPAHAEEMYNPAINGRSDGGAFVVTPKR